MNELYRHKHHLLSQTVFSYEVDETVTVLQGTSRH